MAKLISRTYGDALFDLAMEENSLDELWQESEAILTVLSENPEFFALMSHPGITGEEKLQVVEEVFHGRVSDTMTGFLLLVAGKERFGDLPSILHYFIDRVKEQKKIGVAYVTTAAVLDKAGKEKVEKRLLETTSYQKMEMHYAVDESLIGGMVIRIGDRVVDSSVRTKIEELKRQLMSIQLKSERCV
ncbi:MAG: F0F1 ATP synthase subunit delta [Lachnospiraceae bacterium]|nr:F0F1 ATP synthase subunit delta [Lachnospiraceae bacterium]